MLRNIVNGILHGFPDEFDVDKVMLQYPTDYNESMNTVLT